MPSSSQAQQQAAGIALAAKKSGKHLKLGTPSASMEKMSSKELEKFASTKHKGLPKKKKEEGIEGNLSQVYAVRKPYRGVELTTMVQPVDPLVGLGGSEIVPDQIHAVYPDQDMANGVAKELYEKHMQEESMLEEKKGTTVEKIKKAIDKLEKQRKEHLEAIKLDPKSASQHRDNVAHVTTKIDDLITKMEKIENSKKPIEEKKKK